MNQVCTVTTLREQLRDTIQFVAHNRQLGVAHQYLYFDDPTDPAIERLKVEQDLSVIVCGEAHWRSLGLGPDAVNKLVQKQKLNANHALHHAREAGFEWIAHIDADEHLVVTGGATLADALVRMNTDALDSVLLWTHEAIPVRLEHENPYLQIRQFRNAAASDLLELQEFKCALFDGQFLRGHRGKVISRVSATASLSVHFAHGRSGAKLTPSRLPGNPQLALRHFESCSFERWKRKWRLKADGIADYAGTPTRNRQFQLFLTAQREGEQALEALYRKLYFIPDQCVEPLKELGAIIVCDRV